MKTQGDDMLENQKLNIIISYTNKIYFNKIAKNLTTLDNVSLLASTENTSNILLLCNELHPDIIIFELSSDVNNAAKTSLINKLQYVYNGKISVIVTSSDKNVSENISNALENGAALYVSNLDNPDILQSTLQIILSDRFTKKQLHPSENDLSKIISTLLFKLKLPTHFAGYHFLKSCILNTILRKTRLPESTSSMYMRIAEEYNVNSKQVSRAIYKAVCHINNANDKNFIIKTILDYDLDAAEYDLNAKELVTLIADQLRIRYGII